MLDYKIVGYRVTYLRKNAISDTSQFFGAEEEVKAIEFIKSERDRWQEYSLTKIMDAIIDF